MKDWFGYEYGFVNIDEEHLYFTNSGNWSEIANLKERGETGKYDKLRKLLRVKGIQGVLLLLGFAAALVVAGFTSANLGFAVLLLGGLYSFYMYIRTEVGEAFMLPRKKITGLEDTKMGWRITFVNAGGQADSYLVNGADAKGEDFFKQLKLELEASIKA